MALLWKMICNLGDPMSLRHPVSRVWILRVTHVWVNAGFSIYCVPWSRAVCKRFHHEIRRSHFVVKSLMIDACHACLSVWLMRVTHVWVNSNTGLTRWVYGSCPTYGWVMSHTHVWHIWMSQGPASNASRAGGEHWTHTSLQQLTHTSLQHTAAHNTMFTASTPQLKMRDTHHCNNWRTNHCNTLQ